MELADPSIMPVELQRAGIFEFVALLPSDFAEIRAALGQAYGRHWVREFSRLLSHGRDLIQALTFVLLQILEATTGFPPSNGNGLLIRRLLKSRLSSGS